MYDQRIADLERDNERLKAELSIAENALKIIYVELKRLSAVAQEPLTTVDSLLRRTIKTGE